MLIGPPGAGKGTQASLLSGRCGVAHIATGDLLRAATASGTDIGKAAKGYMDRGDLVPDDLVLQIIRQRLEEPDAKAGFLMDGFPRNPSQAESLEEILDELGHSLDAVVSLEVPDAEIVKRLSSRASCPTCGRVYSNRPDVNGPGECGFDGTTLVRREDDRAEVVQKRLDVFREQTEPLIAYYEGRGLLRHVSGLGTTDQVLDRLAGVLEGLCDGVPS